jgi:hypothetical protein
MLPSPVKDFAAGLEAAFPVIRAEAMALARDEFVPWPLHHAYVGDWLVYPLFLESWPAALGTEFTAHVRRCPQSTAILRRLGARAAAFSRLEPGAHILPHRDADDPGVLRHHLGLVTGSGGYLRVGDEWIEWAEGRVDAFDGQVEHEALNLGQSPRLVLLTDYLVRGPG